MRNQCYDNPTDDEVAKVGKYEVREPPTSHMVSKPQLHFFNVTVHVIIFEKQEVLVGICLHIVVAVLLDFLVQEEHLMTRSALLVIQELDVVNLKFQLVLLVVFYIFTFNLEVAVL